MKIQIFGTGCRKCQLLADHAAEAARQLGLEVELVKVTDLNEIMAQGIMLTPALAVDGQIKVVGKAPSVEELKAVLQASG